MEHEKRKSWRWTPHVVVVVIFLGLALGVWFFTGVTTELLLGYQPGDPVSSETIVAQARALLFGFMAALVGTFCYFGLVQYNFSRESVFLARQMVADLSVSAQQLQMLYDNSPVPYFLMNDAGNIHSPNKAALRFFGTTADMLQVGNLFNLMYDKECQQESKDKLALLQAKVERGVPVTNVEVSLKTFTDERRTALLSIYSLDRSVATTVNNHLVTLQDVTQERESEQVKTDFLLLASHQLRTPTTTIKWYVDYLLETKTLTLDDATREYLSEIYTANERTMDLVSTLLTVSRIEMGMLAPEFAKVSLAEVVDDVLQELNQDIVKRGMRIKSDMENTGSVQTDRSMIRIAIHNLLTNAIKYTPKDGEIRVQVAYDESGAVVKVQDTGYGIPIHEQNHIFAKMFRASNARKISTNGTGLGLYLSKSFVEKLGGTISFESVQEKGTTFTITLTRVARAV